MCTYRRKLGRILRKRVARSCCSRPPRRFIRSTARLRRRSAFFTLPARSARGPDRAEPNVRTAPRRDVREYSAQIRIMTGRPPTSRKMLATTSRKLSDSVGGQGLFNKLARSPAPFPEGGREPGGFLEDHDQLCLAGRRGVEIGEPLQVRPRVRRDLLVGCTGILGDATA